jgi:AcrR family transcriptional regulator
VRLSLVEVGAAGEEGLARRERWFAGFEHFVADALRHAPQPGEGSPLVVKAMVGGVAGVLSRRLVNNSRRVRLGPLIADLVGWMTAYHPTPKAILAEPRRLGPREPQLGGRAPGSLAPHGQLLRRRGLPRGDNNPSRSFVIHNQRERILDAIARLTAEVGYAQVSVEDIVEEAAISLNAFYEHFENKDDAFIVAYEVGHTKCLAYVEAAYAAQGEWRQSVRSGIAALLEFLAAEPAFARIALIDVLTATPRTAERSSLGVSAFAQLLVAGLGDDEAHPRPSEVIVDAIAGGIFELCLDHAIQADVGDLPELAPVATFVALAPFIGADEAAAVAVGSA